MVVLAVELDQFRVKVGADLGKDASQVIDHFLGEHLTTVFRHKDQMGMYLKNTMPLMPNIVFIAHRPNV